MSVLIYTESSEGKFKKQLLKLLLQKILLMHLGTTVTAVSINATENAALS